MLKVNKRVILNDWQGYLYSYRAVLERARKLKRRFRLVPNSLKNSPIWDLPDIRHFYDSYPVSKSKIFAEHNREPVEDLNDREKADPKTEAAVATDLWHEVVPGQLQGTLKHYKEKEKGSVCWQSLTLYQMLLSLRRKGSAPQYPFRKHCTLEHPVEILLVFWNYERWKPLSENRESRGTPWIP